LAHSLPDRLVNGLLALFTLGQSHYATDPDGMPWTRAFANYD
jgi:hypothetical protein